MQKNAAPKAIGKPAKNQTGQWVQTERKAHEAWAELIGRKPRAAMLLHHLVANMAHQNAVVISQKTLSKLIGCGIRTVQYAIADLIAEKWIQVIKLHGPGSVSAYVVNDRVAWGQPRNQLQLSVFSAHVVADIEDQTKETLGNIKLHRIPMLYPGEMQLPDDSHMEPPSQLMFEGFEPDLPSISASEDTT